MNAPTSHNLLQQLESEHLQIPQDYRLPWEGRNIEIAVLGDYILDEYLQGTVNRISPEAPVPVHVVEGSYVTAGGAANASRNIQLAGGRAVLYGMLGKDEAGTKLADILRRDQVDLSSVHFADNWQTIKKTRVTAQNQQIVRIDWDVRNHLPDEWATDICQKIMSSSPSLLLLSDYGKGGITPKLFKSLMKHSKSIGKRVVIDPKGSNYEPYRGAFLITPNRNEACQALGLDTAIDHDPKVLAQRIRDEFGIHHVLVTLGAQGMLGLEHGKDPEEALYLPAQTREVFDVSGAGDTVVGLMALGLASGLSMLESMRIANVGAGLVVEKRGTQPVYLAELKQAIIRLSAPKSTPTNHDSFKSTSVKIIPRQDLQSTILPQSHRQGHLVFTNGCFDILHAGHVSYLEEARKLGTALIVGVNSDASVARLKGSQRPFVSLDDRMQMLAALACVDYVVPFDEDTPSELISAICPDILVKGADYQIHEIAGGEFVLNSGGAVKTIPLKTGLSTTALLNKIRSLG